ncbi:MAG: potassium/proton antiporter [Bacteroidales bacterium]|nr:potassium/proton antiporter [Bacteroidales bacterium]
MTTFLILIAFVIFTCIWLNNISSRIGIPTLLAFIVLGMIFGNADPTPVDIEDKLFAKEACTIALIFIMFYGGFGTKWDVVKPIVKEAGLLASLGVIITAGLTGLLCHFALGWAWGESFLLGAVVSSTDAASVFSILRSKKLGLKNNTVPMLEMESGSNDPCAYMLTAIMISVVDKSATGASVIWMIFTQIVFGAGVGWLVARVAIHMLHRIRFTTQGFDMLFLFATAIASYALPELGGGNGYLSTYIVGMMLGNEHFKGKNKMAGFFDGLTGLMQVLIFFLLGLLAKFSELHEAILPALAISFFLLLIARPAAVFAILSPFKKFSGKQQMLISFVGLRGAASIVFAIMAITGGGLYLKHDLFNIVFCIVLISISLQGSLIPWAARKLEMLDKNSNVFKNFNDYSEDHELHLGEMELIQGDSWDGKAIKDLSLPRSFLIVLIQRGTEQIIPGGGTLLQAGDRLITLNREVENKEVLLEEKTIKKESRRVGHRISDYPGDSLVVLILRGNKSIIPHGDTILEAGDRVILMRR